MNKKSLIQMAVLVVLLIAGGVAFLSTQEGGLDFLGEFIPGLKEEPKSASAPAPVAKPKLDIPPIPAQPAQGKVGGKAFSVAKAAIENGVLTLTQGAGGDSVEIAIDLRTKRWDVPAGRTIKVLKQTQGELPQITLRVVESGQRLAPQTYKDKYIMLLELGAEKDKQLPGKIHMALPDEQESKIAGTFDAQIRGFRIINGKPDLSADSVETFQYLVFRELLKDDPEKAVQDVTFFDARIDTSKASGPATGYMEIDYRVGQSPLTTERWQFVKENGEWRVRAKLRTSEIDEAHPLNPPSAKDAPAALLYLAAKRLEAQVQKKPDQGIYTPSLVARHSDKHKIGVAEVGYRPARNAEPVQVAYLFRFKGNAWVLERELGKREKVNVDSGRIEQAKK